MQTWMQTILKPTPECLRPSGEVASMLGDGKATWSFKDFFLRQHHRIPGRGSWMLVMDACHVVDRFLQDEPVIGV